ncbi:MAG: hypothetical protein SOW93_01825 [Limosilactobacillus reuteri]|nr:hypothetical protein [Limosilactobacillus reuteri]
MESLDMEMLENIHARVNKALYENCLGYSKEHSRKAFEYVAHTLATLTKLDVEGARELCPSSIYLMQSKHYSNEGDNALALIAIREICKKQLLQGREVIFSEFDEIFEILNRIDENNGDIITYW